MANKKRVEGEEMPNFGKIVLDTEEHLQEVPKRAMVEVEPQPTQKRQEAGEPINCLRNERVIVRFVPSPSAMVQTKGHVLWGGMAEGRIPCHCLFYARWFSAREVLFSCCAP